MICLPKEIADKLKDAIKTGKFNPATLNEMESAPRRTFFETFMGKEDAKNVNLLFERKLLLKNQEKAMYDFGREITGLSKKDKEAFIEKVKQAHEDKRRRLYDPAENEKFLNEIVADIYSKKFKAEVSLEEAQTITELAADLKKSMLKKNEDGTWGKGTEEDRLKLGVEAGAKQVALDVYVDNLKRDVTEKRFVNPFKQKLIEDKLGAVLDDLGLSFNFIADNSRSIVAGVLDNSFWGNQGVQVLWNPKYTTTWARNFAESFLDIKKILAGGVKRGDDIMNAVRAEIYSRKNYQLGYMDMGVGVAGIKQRIKEETYPTSIGDRFGQLAEKTKIPVLKQVFEVVGRIAKASEVAYEAGSLRLRADIADKMYKAMEKNGVDMTNEFEVGSQNVVLNGMTGRGNIELGKLNKPINTAMFSIKYLKSNIDFLTANAFDITGSKVSNRAKMESLKNILYVASTVMVALGIAKALDPDSTDLDPRSAKFGTLWGVNMLGGLKSFINLVSRITLQSTKSGTTGIVRPLGTGYGEETGMDIWWQFMEGKASPLFSVIQDYIRGETFDRTKPTAGGEALRLITPMGIGNAAEIYNNKETTGLIDVIYNVINAQGFNTLIYAPSEVDWKQSETKQISQFKEKVRPDEFKAANEEFNTQYSEWYDNVLENPTFQELPDEDKKEVFSSKKEKLTEEIMYKYGFIYQTESKTAEEINNSTIVKSLSQ